MTLAKDTLLLTRRSLIHALRNPVWLFVGVSTPLLYLALFAPLLKHYVAHGNVLDEFLPGILSLMAFASGSGQGFGTIFELRAGVIERFRVTPASRLAILVAPILASMLMMFVFDALLVAVGAAFGFGVHWLGLLVLGVLLGLLMMMWAAFSIAMALLTKEISAFAAVINGLNLPVLLLAGVLLQISVGPEWMRVLRISTRSTTSSRRHARLRLARSVPTTSGRPSRLSCRSARSCSPGRRASSARPSRERACG